MTISFIFAWYDIWIGFFWDKKKKWLYILPLPCIGVILKFKTNGNLRRTKAADGSRPS